MQFDIGLDALTIQVLPVNLSISGTSRTVAFPTGPAGQFLKGGVRPGRQPT
jgi:hypothetical protein